MFRAFEDKFGMFAELQKGKYIDLESGVGGNQYPQVFIY